MRNVHVLSIVTAALLAASPAWAQRPGGGGFGFGGMMLLGQKSVQEELKLSEDQIQKADEYLAKQRESFSGLRDQSAEERRQKFAESVKASRAALGEILQTDQLQRFKEISLQQRGPEALADPEVAEAVGLSDEQKERVGEVQSAARKEMRGLFQQGGDDRQERRKKFAAAREALYAKVGEILTPDQQAKWKQLLGKPFEGEIRSPFGGNRGEGNRNGANAPRQNRDDDQTTSAVEPTAIGPFRLVSFKEDDNDAVDKSDDDAKADDDAKPSDAKKSKGHKHPHRAHHGRGGFSHPDFSRHPGGDRDRAWEHVARAMHHRARGSGRLPMAHRGHWGAFAQGPRHGHFGDMAWGRHARPTFDGPPRHHEPSLAGFDGHRGPGARQFSYHGNRGFGGPMMDRHRGHHGQHGRSMAHHPAFGGHHGRHHPMMARHHGFPGHHGPAMESWHHERGPHAMASRHHHGPRVDFAGHHGFRPMHHAGFERHKDHGHADAGKHGHHPRGDASSGEHKHRKHKGERDDDSDNEDKDKDDD